MLYINKVENLQMFLELEYICCIMYILVYFSLKGRVKKTLKKSVSVFAWIVQKFNKLILLFMGVEG